MQRLPETRIHPRAQKARDTFHAATVKEVEDAIAAAPLVVVGMAQNPVVKRARKALDKAGHPYRYLEYGSYLSEWKPRLAIKLWSGWPTFPQIFVKGQLVGGCTDLEALIADGSLAKLLG
jgi:glutaredoxin-related protein